MCPMKIALSRLLTDAVTIEIPRDAGGAHRFEVASGVNLRGVYETRSGASHLEGVAAESVDLTAFTTFVGSTRIRAAATAFRDVGADLVIGEETRGVGTAAAIAAHGAEVDLGDDTTITATEIGATNMRLGLGPFSTLADTVRATKARVKVGAFEVTVEAIRVGKLSVASTPEGMRIRAEEVDIEGVALEAGGAAIRIEKASLGDVRYGGGTISLNRATIPVVRVSMAKLGSAKDAPKENPTSAPPFDLGFLDLLGGEIDVDVHVDARLPVIGVRSAVHKLRVPVEHGVINFHELERDLSFLEDAVLDFEWKGDRLILEKDIPLVPFDNETLVSWRLDDAGQALAKQKLARLRTLARPEFPSKPAAKPGAEETKPGLQLEKLDFAPVSVSLSLAGPAVVETPAFATTLGSSDTAGIAAINVSGAVRHRAAGAPEEPGALEVKVEGVTAGATSLALGSRRLEIASAAIAEVSRGAIGFVGLAPRSVELEVRGLSLGASELRPAAKG